MIKYVPGQGFVKTYDKGDGSQGSYVLGSQQDQSQKNRFLNKKKAFMDQHGFDQFKDYSAVTSKACSVASSTRLATTTTVALTRTGVTH